MLHFAYGSNMHRAVMARHAPWARPVGAAELPDHRFVITGDGYASVQPMRGAVVRGVVWQLTPRDRTTLDGWENVASGLYRAALLPVRMAGRRQLTLVYVARRRAGGRPKAGYMELVLAAAREWDFPESYIAALRKWLPTAPGAATPRKLSEFRWM